MLCTNCKEQEVEDKHEVWCEDCIADADELDGEDELDNDDEY